MTDQNTKTARSSNNMQGVRVSQLTDGAMVMFVQADATVYVAPDAAPEGVVNLVVSGTPAQGSISTFVMTLQGIQGETAKVALQPVGMQGTFGVTGQNVAGLALPIILGPNSETFIITGSLEGGNCTIRTAFSPPASAIWGYNPTTKTRVLTYGHDQPFIQGLFNIQVVG